MDQSRAPYVESIPVSYTHLDVYKRQVQQVAGAAGTALFVTVMTIVATGVAGSPEALDVHALAAGTRVAFLLGGAAATLGVVFSFFITEEKPAGESSPATAQAH